LCYDALASPPVGPVGIDVERSRGTLDDLFRDHHLLDAFELGRSNIVSSRSPSMIERRPRAPVLRSIALRAMAPSASSASVRSGGHLAGG
jgi:hypothetical protein